MVLCRQPWTLLLGHFGKIELKLNFLLSERHEGDQECMNTVLEASNIYIYILKKKKDLSQAKKINF